VFGTIPGNPLAANRPEKVVETERVQREDRKEKSAGERRRFSKKRSRKDGPADQAGAPERPEQFGKQIDFEA
jgi:hypothetical protein